MFPFSLIKFNLMTIKKLICLCVSMLLFCFTLPAQEVQVPFDHEGRIFNMDASLARKTGLFSNYENLLEARIFLHPDSSYQLEILSTKGNQYVKFTRKIDETEYHQIQNMVTATVAGYEENKNREEILEGRTKLIVSNTLTGMVFYAWSIPLAFNVEDPKVFTAIYMFTSGTSFFLPFALTRNKNIAYSDASAWLYGQTRGIAHGMLIPASFSASPDESSLFAFGILGSVTEAYSLYALSKNLHLSTGQVYTMSTYGDFGFLVGGLTYLAFQSSSSSFSQVAPYLLLGSLAGGGIGYALSSSYRYSSGDAHLTYTAGALGTYVAFTANVLAENSNSRSMSAITLAGSLAGLAAGHFLSGYTNYSSSQGLYTGLGTLAASLVGTGIGYLIGNDNEKILAASGAIGALAGFGTMNYVFLKTGSKKNVSFSPKLSLSPVACYNSTMGHFIMAPGMNLQITF